VAIALLKANAVVFKPPNSYAVWLSLACINGKYLWALPTPTTFEKVDQTFIITCRNNLLNHNFC
ncbi:hypothetical protein, partial [Ruminococcus intestinalis]|uniref:hypothetical protein n=1 Tax=Ruminococcus intestinalis TaxID=2763066 RepID=UPI003F80A23B